ncbi:Histone acetyltransferase MCC1 [Hibiscus syriacus]|uniref:N-alpha-acetyltransferase 60 n=1 Tax=Hibiscus syriacus TaxID=106335 RepID=A0A6A2Y4W5_HIBSY|nr:histone acetyltransferase MCC1-like isoform X2 [Hibiscus syriacus]KAE8670986.1 Histone acetyltransferase MCC1 [Hibiscus syriacus]
MIQSLMVNPRIKHRPTICYRPIQPSDLETLEKIHSDLFPIRYESEFFQSVVNGCDVVSWAAVDRSRPNDQSDELIGFVTARIIMVKDSEIADLLRYDSSRVDQNLVYILTLGVVEAYRNLSIATALIREVIKYASSIPVCRAVYLHVISYNNPAIHLYTKMSFKCMRMLHGFYLIRGQHFDSYLFVYYINGGRSPCSPLELITLIVCCTKTGLKTVASKLMMAKPKWPKGNETRVPVTQSKRMANTECSGLEYV